MKRAAGKSVRSGVLSPVLSIAVGWLLAIAFGGKLGASEAHWIWSPQHAKDQVPAGACHFRKTFSCRMPQRAQITIAADDEYELYINGEKVGTGRSYRRLDEYNVTQQIRPGRNIVAVRVMNLRGSTAALVARIFVKERQGNWQTYSTDRSWRTQLSPFPFWNRSFYNDRYWEAAQSFGQLGATTPWDREEGVAEQDTSRSERFRISREFEVQRLLGPEDTGSLIAMAFDEFGHIVASQESGPLLLIYDSDQDGIPDTVRPYCDKIDNVQGILPLNGSIYATGVGPEGQALYRLSDRDHDGMLEALEPLLRFEGEMGEHSAHGLVLGPDGWLYLVIGNHTTPLQAYEAASPLQDCYAGDLVGPRYEDPSGHAAGRKVPGGAIMRVNLAGDRVQLVAGGLRNAYDLAFNRHGDLFVHDSDMESDMGMTWYRPTRLYHVIPGADFGWRSGWSKWPSYYADVLPPILQTGRSSPTGSVFYDHIMFPRRYQGALFLGDWSEGRILAVRLKPDGATYSAEAEVFVQGQPLNVTDLAVGPDGGLYFITGGRGTGGGIYRVVWNGDVPASVRDLGTGISPVIRQPQLQSAWARQRIARRQADIGDDWAAYTIGVARSTANPTRYRLRALNLMQLYGPVPPQPLLRELAQDQNEAIRAHAAVLIGIHGDDTAGETLVALLADTDRTVRRKACEALLRRQQSAPVEDLLPLLASDDRFEAWAARRVLAETEAATWRETLLADPNHRLFNRAALALLANQPSRDNALAVLEQASRRMTGFVSDREFTDMLRVMQVAIHKGEIAPDLLIPLRDQLVEEFPAGNSNMNRELIRLLAYLQASSIMDRYLEYLASDASREDRVHVALHLRFLISGWTTEQKLRLIEFLAAAKQWEGGGSYAAYIGNVTRDFAKRLSREEGTRVLTRGAEWPDAALGALYKLPHQLDVEARQALMQLDRAIDSCDDSSSKQLMVGIVAVLARDGQPESLEYLREIWDRNPERREPVAMGLAQQPGGANWDYLVQSLPILEGGTAREVLRRLRTVDRQPEDPESLRQVLLCGLRLKQAGANDAVALLEHWSGEHHSDTPDDWEATLAAWKTWFAERYPEYPPAELPRDSETSKWKFDDLMEFLESDEGQAGEAARGAVVFEEALCIKCHRYGDQGESMGPDLTSLAKTFTRKEIVQSLLYPSHIISSQYTAKTLLLADGRQLAGIVAPGPEGEKIVLNAEGEKVSVREEEIDEIFPSQISNMPEGLLDELTLQQIADLFSYMTSPPNQGVALRVTD